MSQEPEKNRPRPVECRDSPYGAHDLEPVRVDSYIATPQKFIRGQNGQRIELKEHWCCYCRQIVWMPEDD